MHASTLPVPLKTPFTLTPESLPLLLQEAEAALSQTIWPSFEQTCYATTERVLNAFTQARVGEEHFYSVTGYGHNDMGREALDKLFAMALQAEAALVRPQLVSGTHALATGLRALLKHGDLFLSLTGAVYDTLEPVLGLNEPVAGQSLKAHGVELAFIDPFTGTPAEELNLPQDEASIALIQRAKVLYFQRSRGYSSRPSLTLPVLGRFIAQAKALNPHAVVMVDNCYGEFVELNEPTTLGADLIAGSLIKNPGGGLALTGGYLAGKQSLIDEVADVLTCPGVGAEGGYMGNLTRTLMQGLFLAPSVVKEAKKAMSLAAYLFARLGYSATPAWDAPRADIIQTLQLGSPEALVKFCQALQAVSPVSSYVNPIPAFVPGYQDAVIMAGGTFIDGSSIELSADAPLREPYQLFLQGGLTYAHSRLALQRLLLAVAL
jgi:cystathionine beta-lyase family protein involved in aluminum resistance